MELDLKKIISEEDNVTYEQLLVNHDRYYNEQWYSYLISKENEETKEKLYGINSLNITLPIGEETFPKIKTESVIPPKYKKISKVKGLDVISDRLTYTCYAIILKNEDDTLEMKLLDRDFLKGITNVFDKKEQIQSVKFLGYESWLFLAKHLDNTYSLFNIKNSHINYISKNNEFYFNDRIIDFLLYKKLKDKTMITTFNGKNYNLRYINGDLKGINDNFFITHENNKCFIYDTCTLEIIGEISDNNILDIEIFESYNELYDISSLIGMLKLENNKKKLFYVSENSDDVNLIISIDEENFDEITFDSNCIVEIDENDEPYIFQGYRLTGFKESKRYCIDVFANGEIKECEIISNNKENQNQDVKKLKKEYKFDTDDLPF